MTTPAYQQACRYSLNQCYGDHTVSFGLTPKTNAGFLGTKIAFNRVPTLEEFSE